MSVKSHLVIVSLFSFLPACGVTSSEDVATDGEPLIGVILTADGFGVLPEDEDRFAALAGDELTLSISDGENTAEMFQPTAWPRSVAVGEVLALVIPGSAGADALAVANVEVVDIETSNGDDEAAYGVCSRSSYLGTCYRKFKGRGACPVIGKKYKKYSTRSGDYYLSFTGKRRTCLRSVNQGATCPSSCN